MTRDSLIYITLKLKKMEELTFTKRGSGWICQLTEEQQFRGGVIQILQKERGIVSVRANLPGMPPSVVAVYQNPYDRSVIFEIDIPDGLETTIKSGTEVEMAVWKKQS